MATELPLYNPPSGVIHSDRSLQESTVEDDAFLQQLLGPEDDLLTTLLESANSHTMDNPPLNFDFDWNPLLNLPTSPVLSDVSTSKSPPCINPANSPGSITSGSDELGNSPMNSSSSSFTMQPLSSLGMSEPTLDSLIASTCVEQSVSSNRDVASEVKIDVDYMATSQSPDLATREESTEWSQSDLKAHTLLLTEEEKKLLAEEGITLPTDMPLTKAEQKQLKRIRRKIKNKISAQESRKRKKDYVDGLENRVKICTDRNRELKREVDCLRQQNISLMSQLKKLQAVVAQYNPSKVQAGSVLLVVVMSFAVFFVPNLKQFGGPQSVRSVTRNSRALLYAETDEFGNVIDPNNGLIISRAGGQSPMFPPPWVYQTPAFRLFSTRLGTPDKLDAPSDSDVQFHITVDEEHEVERKAKSDNDSSTIDNNIQHKIKHL